MERPVILRADDVQEMCGLLNVFDRITFGCMGDMLAQLDTELPLIGPVVVSLFVRESHVQVWRKNDPDCKGIVNGYFNISTREKLLEVVRKEIHSKLDEILTPNEALLNALSLNTRSN